MLSKTISSIRISGLVGLALATACGGDDEPKGQQPVGTTDGAVTTPEAGSGTLDAGAGDAGQCLVTPLGTGVTCTPAGGGIGYRLCTNGVPTGECMSFLSNDSGIDIDAAIGAIRDSGLFADSGISIGEGGITFGDATIPLPEAGTLKCPNGYTCSSSLGAFFPGISACTVTGGDGLFPPTEGCMGATASTPCKVGTSNGTCFPVPILGAYCVVPCN